MDTLYGKCGNHCTHCPSYKHNLRTDNDRRACSQGWHTYHGFRLKPEKLIACDGCQPVPENGNGTRYINCLIRRCALHNGVQTCAHCEDYPCQVITERVLGGDWLADLTKKMGSIPDEDFNQFIEPYLGIPHLDAVREALDPGKIVPIRPVSLKPRLSAYPPELESTPGLDLVYHLLQGLNAPIDDLSYAQAESYKETRTHLLKILWSFARFGEFDQAREALVLDHKVYLDQKIHSSLDRVETCFEILNGHGLHCEVIPLLEDRWLTPKGALRRGGARESSPPWDMTMKAGRSIGGKHILDALQAYATALDRAYGKGAYRRFARADLTVLTT